MALSDPVHVYDAETYNDAVIAQMFLESNGIEAFSIDDTPVFTTWMFGLLPGIHKPRVWVSRSEEERARTLLEEFQDQRRGRRANTAADAIEDAEIQVTCEDCGKVSSFPASKRGTVQD